MEMKLKIKNPKLIDMGFHADCTLDQPFLGHQVGIVICIFNNETKEIEKTYLPKDVTESIEDIIKRSDELGLLEQYITQLDRTTDKLVSKVLYMIPYVPENSSTLLPTCIDSNISGAMNVHYNCKIELCFVEDEGLCRFIVMNARTRNVCMLELVKDLLEECDDEDAIKEAFTSDPSFLRYIDERNAERMDLEGPGYAIDYFDEFGNNFTVIYRSGNHAFEKLQSVRMLECECVIEH